MTTMTVLDTTPRTAQPPTVDSPYMTKRAVAKFLNVSERTVDRLMASGDLGYVRVRGQVRFSLHDVVRFLVKNEVSSIA
jgi:excisionase family DNA binding protein